MVRFGRTSVARKNDFPSQVARGSSVQNNARGGYIAQGLAQQYNAPGGTVNMGMSSHNGHGFRDFIVREHGQVQI